jgi:hypothetical protein
MSLFNQRELKKKKKQQHCRDEREVSHMNEIQIV